METIKVPLTKGYFAVIDAADAALVAQHRWHASVKEKLVYAGTNIRVSGGQYRYVRMHQLFMGHASVDHIDGDGLNNRRSNLRPCTYAQNACNRRSRTGAKSSYYGVTFDQSGGRKPWRARAQLVGGASGSKRFATEIEAAIYRDVLAKELHGEFARLNFPDGPPSVEPAPALGYPVACAVCGETFMAKVRNRAKYCSQKCRNKGSPAC